jgi:hypothetical protein
MESNPHTKLRRFQAKLKTELLQYNLYLIQARDSKAGHDGGVIVSGFGETANCNIAVTH